MWRRPAAARTSQRNRSHPSARVSCARDASSGVPKYTVRFVRSARKELEQLTDAMLQRVFPRIEAPADTPRPPGCKKLRGAKDLWRIRVGAFRVVYQIDDGILLVEIRAIGDRKDICA